MGDPVSLSSARFLYFKWRTIANFCQGDVTFIVFPLFFFWWKEEGVHLPPSYRPDCLLSCLLPPRKNSVALCLSYIAASKSILKGTKALATLFLPYFPSEGEGRRKRLTFHHRQRFFPSFATMGGNLRYEGERERERASPIDALVIYNAVIHWMDSLLEKGARRPLYMYGTDGKTFSPLKNGWKTGAFDREKEGKVFARVFNPWVR